MGLAVFAAMPLLAPFIAIYATSLLTPHASHDRYSHSLCRCAFAIGGMFCSSGAGLTQAIRSAGLSDPKIMLCSESQAAL
jgi:hypothetical protein